MLGPPLMHSLRAHRGLLIFLPGRFARPALCGFSSAGSAASALAHRVEVTTLLRDRCYAVHEFGVKGFRVGYFAPSVFLLRFLRYPLRLLGLRHPLYPSYVQSEVLFFSYFGFFLCLFTLSSSALAPQKHCFSPFPGLDAIDRVTSCGDRWPQYALRRAEECIDLASITPDSSGLFLDFAERLWTERAIQPRSPDFVPLFMELLACDYSALLNCFCFSLFRPADYGLCLASDSTLSLTNSAAPVFTRSFPE